jgi:hypothetical protein
MRVPPSSKIISFVAQAKKIEDRTHGEVLVRARCCALLLTEKWALDSAAAKRLLREWLLKDRSMACLSDSMQCIHIYYIMIYTDTFLPHCRQCGM